MDNEAIATRLAEIKASVIAAAHKTDGTAYEQVRALGLAVYELIILIEIAMAPRPSQSDPGKAVPGSGVGNAAQKADVAPVEPVQKVAVPVIPVTEPGKPVTEPVK